MFCCKLILPERLHQPSIHFGFGVGLLHRIHVKYTKGLASLIIVAPVDVFQNIFHSGGDEFEVRYDLLDSHISICSPQVSLNADADRCALFDWPH